MAQVDSKEFAKRVYETVRAVPPGRVITYGRLALLAGRPNGARAAGKAVGQAPEGTPCHRVVNSAGRTAPGWAGQRLLLEAEGVVFKANGNVDLKCHLWK